MRTLMVDQASHDQVLLALAAIILASVTTLGIVIKALLTRIERHVNNVEEDIDHDHGPTLGQQVRGLVKEVHDGFKRNDETHDLIQSEVEQISKRIDQNTTRIDRLEDRKQ